MDESRTRALLAAISADPEPPARFDVDRIMAEGRRPRHRAAWVLAAAAAVVAVMVAVIALVRPGAATPDPVVSPPPAVPSPVTVAPTAFDPLRTLIVPRWRPDGLGREMHSVGETGESYVAWSEETGSEVSLGLGVRNAPPSRFGGGNGKPEPGPDVNGAASTWEPGEDGGLLRWDWAPGAPAVVRVLRLEDAREVATRFASSLELTVEHPVALPFAVSRPTGLRVVGSQPTDGVLSFNGDDGPAHAVTVRRFAGGAPDPDFPVPSNFRADTTVNGKPASIEATGLRVVVVQKSGDEYLGTNCQVRKGYSVAEVRAECLRVARSAELVGTLADPSTWTISPVRKGK